MDLTDFTLNGGKQEIITVEGKYAIDTSLTNFKVLKRAMTQWNKENSTLYATYTGDAGNLLFSVNADNSDVTSYFVCKVVAYNYRIEQVNVFFTIRLQYISPV